MTANNSTKTNILFLWDVPEQLERYLREGWSDIADHLNLTILHPYSREEALIHAPTTDVMVGWRPDPELLRKAHNLRLFINPGAGVQHLIALFKEVNASRDHPIVLVNGHGNAYFTAQHAVALLLSVMNKVVLHHQWMAEGLWRRGDSHGKSTPLRRKVVGLLGYGAVNQKVHRFLSGFDVEFAILKRTWDQTPEFGDGSVQHYQTHQLAEFMQDSDVVIVAVPSTPETEGLVGEDELQLLGPEGVLVNMARGPVVDEEALYYVLATNAIAGAGVDVWYNYNPDPLEDGRFFPFNNIKHPFHKLSNIVLSPHRGASPMDDLQRWDEVVRNVKAFRNEKGLVNIVELDRGY